MSEYDVVIYRAERPEIVAGDTRPFKKTMKKTLDPNKRVAKAMFQSLLFHFPDYDDDPREVHAIPEVRSWLQKLDREYPHLLYFIVPDEYILYIAAVSASGAGGLTMPALLLFLNEHNDAIDRFAKRVGHDPDLIQAHIGQALAVLTGRA